MFKKEETMREIMIYNEKIKFQSMLHFKSTTITIVISAILYCFINFNVSAYCAPISEIGDTWSKILTPFNSYIGDVSPYHLEGHNGTYINKKKYYFTVPGIYQEYVEGSMKDEFIGTVIGLQDFYLLEIQTLCIVLHWPLC